MKKRIFRLTIWISIVILIIVFNGGLNFTTKRSTARAVGDLSVDWGVPEDEPIFVVDNMAPGETESREVLVVNNASTVRPVGVRGIKTSESGDLSTVLDIVISQNGEDLYGGTSGTGDKTLVDFFAESAEPNGIPLFNLNPGVTATIDFKVTFDENAGNQFQGKTVIFDLKIGIAIAIPPECNGINLTSEPIFGTEGDDNISGTNGSDLIYGFEGNDVINSLNGDDCVVGGEGDDRITNSNGNDILFGNDGDDKLNGSNGHDAIFGGMGNDAIRGSNGNDIIQGDEGDDKIDSGNGDDIVIGGVGNDQVNGSNGNDQIFGGPGDDKLNGQNGHDYLEGNGGNDSLFGGNGNDTLLGALGVDSADGQLGRDTCEAELKKRCEF